MHADELLTNLVQREHDAVVVYDRAAVAWKGSNTRSAIAPIRMEHMLAFYALRASCSGFRPRPSDGGLPSFVRTVNGVLCSQHGVPGLEVLRTMECGGIAEYESVLLNAAIFVGLRSIIVRKFLPEARPHVAILEGLQRASVVPDSKNMDPVADVDVSARAVAVVVRMNNHLRHNVIATRCRVVHRNRQIVC